MPIAHQGLWSHRSERQVRPSITQAAELMNGDLIRAKLTAKDRGVITELLKRQPALKPEQVVEEMYLAYLTRRPTAQEIEVAVPHVGRGREGVEDLAWALLNSAEFLAY